MLKLAQVEGSYPLPPEQLVWIIETGGQGAEVCPRTAEQQNIGRRLLHQHHVLWRVEPRTAGQAMHPAILQPGRS